MAEITLEKALTLQEFYIKIWQGNGYYPCKKYLKEGDKWRCHDSKRNENGLFWYDNTLNSINKEYYNKVKSIVTTRGEITQIL